MDAEEFYTEGVWATRTRAHPDAPSQRPALVFVHDGGHASWCWEHLLPFFAQAGWECLAFDWYNHGRSARTDPQAFLNRSIGAVAKEIGIVAGLMDGPAVLIGHGMGGAAALAYAELSEVAGLVLLAPAVPAGLGAEPVETPVNPGRLFPPVPLETARQMLFTSLGEPLAAVYHELLRPESAQAVKEASRRELQVDLDLIRAPALVFAGELDVLAPPAAVARLAHALGAEYVPLRRRGHDDLLLFHGSWPLVAKQTLDWLNVRFR